MVFTLNLMVLSPRSYEEEGSNEANCATVQNFSILSRVQKLRRLGHGDALSNMNRGLFFKIMG